MKVSTADYQKMKDAYRLDVAKFIARAAREGKRVTYSDLEKEFGIIAKAWGKILGGIAIRCHENGIPLLSVLVVRSGTDHPSKGAVLYEDFGLTTDDIANEQQRCFDFDWSAHFLGKE